MKRMNWKLIAALLAVLMLLCALGGCTEPAATTTASTDESGNAPTPTEVLWSDATYQADTTLGEGAKTVLVTVKAEEKSVTFTVKTDCETLADALLAVGLAEGEQSSYGLYIKKVNGILADYDVNQRYWSLKQNGKTLMTGASGVTKLDGAQYELVYTK